MKKKLSEETMNRRSAFTLIEIILVIVIIGILSTVALKGLNITGKTETAKIAQAQATIATLSSAIQEFEIINGDFPGTHEELLDETKGGPFLSQRSIPIDPWGESYVYTVPGAYNTHTFDLSCTSGKGVVVNNWE